MRSTLRWASRSDTGRVRVQNEDSIHADGDVFIVADGMGGHLAGEVASAMAVSTIVERCHGGVASLDEFGEAVREANRRVIGESDADSNREGMGTTVVAVARMADPENHKLALANVGDSRAYLFDEHGLRQLSKDHSLVQELVDDGVISPDDARHHPRRNIVTRALGIDPAIVVDLWEIALPIGGRILLCSDGLVDEVEESTIAEVLSLEDDPEIAADRLIGLANDHGGRDNVSLVLLQRVGSTEPTDPTAEIELVAPATPPAITPEQKPRKNGRSLLRRVVATLTVLAALTFGSALAATGIRSGYTVTFDAEGDVVVLRGHDILWFEPTIEARGPSDRGELDAVSRDLVDSEPKFDTLDEAVDFIVGRLSVEEER
jgi:serine/threonine protein phosphatase PrpC